MRYACMEACWRTYPVRMMARLLAVSPSGYYAWRGRAPSGRGRATQRLLAEMRTIHQESDGTYGSPRMRTELQARGHQVGPVAANILARAFTPTQPNQVWAGDITYVRTDEGWLYLAVVLDLYSRRVIGWAMQDRIGHELDPIRWTSFQSGIRWPPWQTASRGGRGGASRTTTRPARCAWSSLTATPASASLRMPIIWVSMNFDFRITAP